MSGLINTEINLLKVDLKVKLNQEQEDKSLKRPELDGVYRELYKIVESFPDRSPNNILHLVDGMTYYFHHEDFKGALVSLDGMLVNRKNALNQCNDLGKMNQVNSEIYQIEYAKEQITKIRDQYISAKEAYDEFLKSESFVTFHLKAGQNVKNCLVEFDKVIGNVFVSGMRVDDPDDSTKNMIDITRKDLLDSMRNDLGSG